MYVQRQCNMSAMACERLQLHCKGVSHDSLISVILMSLMCTSSMPAALQMRMHDMPFYSTNSD